MRLVSIIRNFQPGRWVAPLAILAVTAVMAGCSGSDATKQLTAEERFADGMKKFDDGDYLEAIEDFKVVTIQYQASTIADKAQFYMGECRFRREEFVLAAYEYDVLIRTMPTSPLVPRARFQRATCFYELSPKYYLDQENTSKALDEYQAFIEYSPTDSLVPVAETRIGELNTKLAEKMYENGVTYQKMEYYKAATYYFDLVLEKYHDTPYAELALKGKAEALQSRKRYAEALESISRFFVRYPNSAYRTDVEALRKSIEDDMAAARKTSTRAAIPDSSGTGVSPSPRE